MNAVIKPVTPVVPSTVMPAVIVADHLTIGYDDLPVVDDLNFDIRQQEFVSLLGPSGCGKSTLLRAMAGLLKPMHGSLTMHSNSDAAEPASTRVGLMFQKPLLLPWRTALQNILLPVEIERDCPKTSKDHLARARHVLSLVQLSQYENAYPNQLSGGMQQRVALARALMADPDLLLLDEPFGALDEITRETLNEELLQIWRSADSRLKTIVMVTHSVSEAVALSDRIFVFAARPAKLLDIVSVPLTHPRAQDSQAFTASVAEVRQLIRQTP